MLVQENLVKGFHYGFQKDKEIEPWVFQYEGAVTLDQYASTVTNLYMVKEVVDGGVFVFSCDDFPLFLLHGIEVEQPFCGHSDVCVIAPVTVDQMFGESS